MRPASHKGIFIHGWLSKSTFLWALEGWTFLAVVLLMSPIPACLPPAPLQKTSVDACMLVSKVCCCEECVEVLACASWPVFKSLLCINT